MPSAKDMENHLHAEHTRQRVALKDANGEVVRTYLVTPDEWATEQHEENDGLRKESKELLLQCDKCNFLTPQQKKVTILYRIIQCFIARLLYFRKDNLILQ